MFDRRALGTVSIVDHVDNESYSNHGSDSSQTLQAERVYRSQRNESTIYRKLAARRAVGLQRLPAS